MQAHGKHASACTMPFSRFCPFSTVPTFVGIHYLEIVWDTFRGDKKGKRGSLQLHLAGIKNIRTAWCNYLYPSASCVHGQTMSTSRWMFFG